MESIPEKNYLLEDFRDLEVGLNKTHDGRRFFFVLNVIFNRDVWYPSFIVVEPFLNDPVDTLTYNVFQILHVTKGILKV